ncbi:hypothetical protein I7I53_11848 [Histoplasma capsulatum var. duboisii H88]|uniref:Uncharacterized protein n=1 Tax=Ajellomyces capsulatus (strain H88) TaxID=544711 RepID=A0A8A1LTS7_AJEC8|nr:hypothetical protein I7I53_11848 [Histoplasma capsulatum var. duboisii H88]
MHLDRVQHWPGSSRFRLKLYRHFLNMKRACLDYLTFDDSTLNIGNFSRNGLPLGKAQQPFLLVRIKQSTQFECA